MKRVGYLWEKLRVRHYVRYADDVVFLDSSKKKLHKARRILSEMLEKHSLHFKKDWQVWKNFSRPLDFIGFRFYEHWTNLRRRMFYSLGRAVRKIKAFGIKIRQVIRYLSYMGWAKRIPFAHYYVNYIKPVLSKGTAKHIMSRYARKQLVAT